MKFVVRKSREDLRREQLFAVKAIKKYSKKGLVNEAGKKVISKRPGGYWKVVRDSHTRKDNPTDITD